MIQPSNRFFRSNSSKEELEASRVSTKKRRRESTPGASESRSQRKCYGADGVGAAASMVLVVVDVVVVGVPEGAGASCVVVVSVVVVASFF